jgi:hypothetical protein
VNSYEDNLEGAMSIIRVVRWIIETWHTEELERLVAFLEEQTEQNTFHKEVIDAVEQEIQRRKDAE